MNMRTPISRARGLGSAKDGTHHWWMHRLTGVALVPLTLWFVVSMIFRAAEDQAAVSAWLASPLNAVLMLLLIVATFHHMQLGLQVVVEDYIHGEAVKLACMVGLKLGSFALATAAAFAVLKVAF